MFRPTSKSVKHTNDSLQTTAFETYKCWLLALFRCNPSPLAENLHTLLRAGQFEELMAAADAAVSQTYDTAASHFEAHQFASLIRKYPWPKDLVNLDPEQKALDSFLASEQRCREINEAIRGNSIHLTLSSDKLQRMRDWIRYVIGERPDMSRIVDEMRITSGASIGAGGSATHLAKKLGSEFWTAGAGCYTYAYWGIMNDVYLRQQLFETQGYYPLEHSIYCFDPEAASQQYRKRVKLVNNNNIAFVPKTAKTHRVIAVEPMLSSYVQKGIDIYMRKLLKRVGIDLSDQSRNQRMAREGSLNLLLRAFATIDLSSASDSICIEIARLLLPVEWFELLNSTRSAYYKLPGSDKLHRYEKFCNMGNGFCFPLETLIFAAAAVASGCESFASESTMSVYGDDIIVPGDIAGELIDLLAVMGFSTNKSKTFVDGPFRESCGSDWYSGLDVRPYTLDHELDSLSALHKCLNLSNRNEKTTSFFSGARQILIDRIPTDHQFFRPFDGNDDSGITTTGDEHLYCPNVWFDKQNRTWVWRELVSRAVEDVSPHPTRYRRTSIDMYAILLGAKPATSRRTGSPVGYTMRRETREKVTLFSHSGSTSLWTPPADRTMIRRSTPLSD